MKTLFKSRKGKIGLPPGSIVHVGDARSHPVRITIFDYDATVLEEKQVDSVEECFRYKDRPTTTWINIDGVHQADVIEKIGAGFGLHHLLLEDIANTGQRPKVDDMGDYLFLVLKMVRHDERLGETVIEQVSMVVGANFVISFQEVEGDIFDGLRERIRNNKGRVRKMGADYLCYALTDLVVDNFFTILERLSARIEGLEDKVVGKPDPAMLRNIHDLKKELILLRQSMWPMREAIGRLARIDSPLMTERTAAYFNDVYDHAVQVVDTMEMFREVVSGLLEIHLSSLGNKTNEVMRILTIIATIFIPLTFVVGVYGMNFKNMPELEWKYGYHAVWILVVAIAAALVVFFRQRKWL